MHFSAVMYVMGWLTATFGMFMLLPAMCSAYYHGTSVTVFALCALASMAGGVVLVLMYRQRDLQLSRKDGILITCLAWVGLSVLGAVPLYFTVAPHFMNALFEAVSGLTTTGGTVLSGLDTMDKGILLWRSLLQFLGGMGLVVLAVAILPFLGIGGMGMYQSEAAGMSKDKLQPRVKETARILWLVYILMNVLCIAALVWAGMGWFDAVNHGLTTLSTGGFSTKDASTMGYPLGAIHYVMMFFMFMGALNFVLHYQFLVTGRLSVYWRNSELMAFFILMLGSSLLIALVLFGYGVVPNAWLALHHAAFNVISLGSSAGFSSADFALWPPAAGLILTFVVFIGGCAGSTCGGLKTSRALVVVKQGLREVHRLLHPKGVRYVKLDGVTISPEVVQSAWAFVGMYVFIFGVLTLAMTLCGYDLTTAYSSIVVNLGNAGPGLGQAGPYVGYGHMNDAAKLTLIAAMLLGRLEIFTLIIIFIPAFWRK
ncbi:MAG: potassium transporter TrkG [Alphaproteobacteria bacterium]